MTHHSYFLMASIGALLLRIVIFGGSISEGISMLALSAVYGLVYFVESKPQATLDVKTLDRLQNFEADLKAVKSSMDAIKLSSSLLKR